MNWNDLTTNPKVVLGYFDKAPSLDKLTLHRMSLLRDGPSAELVFDVSEFPQRPSSKWPPEANRCQIILRAIGLSATDISAWGTEICGRLEIKSTDGLIDLVFAGEGTFTLTCSHIDVASVSAYIDDGD